MPIDPRQVRWHFDRAAKRYGRFAYVQRKILGRALALGETYIPGGAFLLDAGCGDGALARSETAKRRQWDICQLDLSFAMCRQAGGMAVQADLGALPFAAESFSHLFCLSTLQWAADPAQALRELARVLDPGGIAIIYSFGPETLRELRDAFGGNAPVIPFEALETLTGLAADAGFETLENSRNLYVDYFEDAWSVMHSLKAIGATYPLNRGKGLGRRERFLAMEKNYEARRMKDGMPVTWEVMHMVLRRA